MALWNTTIGQGTSRRTQGRITNIRVKESFGHIEFLVRVARPTTAEKEQDKGRIDAAIIQIKRGTDVLIEGFIEDVQLGADYVQYTGRSFLILLGYSTASTTSSGGVTEAEYSGKSGNYIIEDLISKYCTIKDSEVSTSISLKDIYGVDVEYVGDVKLHGKKVYQIVREMCQSYGHDLWSSTIWSGNNVDTKNINVGTKTRGDSVTAHTTLKGGVHLKGIPIVTYRSSETINCLRVIGGGTGKDKVSVFVEDAVSVAAIGYIEGEPYHSNMVRSVETAQSIGEAIIDAKKDPIVGVDVETALYINDLRYGDWVRIVDSYSGLDVIKRIKSITRMYDINSTDAMILELGDKFDNYQNIINDLTKGDVEEEPDMSKAGGSFRITANDPPSDWVRVDGGSWYGTDGVLYTRDGDGAAAFFSQSPPVNPSTDNYMKAIVQIADVTLSISVKRGSEWGSYTDAQSETVSADTANTPLGEIILRGSGSDNISDIYDTYTDVKSYIYRDARPIVGSSAQGFGGAGSWELTTEETWAASTLYTIGDFISPTVANDKSYECTTGGTSGTVEPTWTLTLGSTNSDGSCTWTCRNVRLVPINRPTLTDMDIWVRPQGDGIVYLG
jgi:hypothetical protein